jgi:hypothetical protein
VDALHRDGRQRGVIRAFDVGELLWGPGPVVVLDRLEVERLDALHAAHWPMAMAGDLKSAALVLRAMDQRIRLLGLDQRPAGGRVAGPVSIVLSAS